MKFFGLLLFLAASIAWGNSQQKAFNKTMYYKVMSSEDLNAINNQLTLLKETSLNEKEAYEGTLLMKKAGLITNPKEKLNFFRTGRLKLEACIKKDSLNGELYFLRLIIQEHAPKIMNYSSEIKKDSEYIERSYKNMPTVVREAIIDYSKKSKVLKIKEN